MMEEILAKEEEHADELVNLLFAVEPHTGGSPQRLYFGDEVPGQSDAGQKVAQENHRNIYVPTAYIHSKLVVPSRRDCPSSTR